MTTLPPGRRGARRAALFATAAVTVALALAIPTSVPAAASEPSSGLSWHACEAWAPEGIDCGTLTVPVRWDDPSSAGVFRLPVGRIPATGGPQERIGVLVFNPGGPGGPGVPFLRLIHDGLPETVQRRFDLVTWNPRGTFATSPALRECPLPEIEVPATGSVDWSTVAIAHTEAKAAALASCFALNPEVAPFLGTRASARDIDALRMGLGERRINFWGMSYGSTMGRVYAQAFPTRVRTLILDGAIDPMATTGSYAREQMWSHAMSMARMLQWMPPAYRAAHRRVLSELDDRTVTTSWGSTITRYQVAMGISEFSGRQANWGPAKATILAARNALFARAAADRTEAADLLAELLGVPRPGAREPSRIGDLVLSFVNCADFPERIPTDEIVTVTEQAALISGIASGGYALTEGTMCAGLPVYGTPIDQRPAIRIPTPPVVVNSVADPYTSLWSATLMANAFPGARLITYDSSQHVTYSRTDSECVNDAVTMYLLTKRLPARDLACPLSPPFAP